MRRRSKNEESDVTVKILEATIVEFNKNGLKFTMDELSSALSMSKKTLYKYFKDKESLFLRMVDYCFSAIKESEISILHDPALSLTDKIRHLIIVLPEKYAELDLRKLWELKDDYPKVFMSIEKRIESDWEPTFNLINEAVEKGLIRPVSLPVFKAIVEATIEHFLTRPALVDAGLSYTEGLNEMIDILMLGIEQRRQTEYER